MKKSTVRPADLPDDIFCMVKIGSSMRPAFCVWVAPDPGRAGDPYLKYYDAQNYTQAGSVVRLGLKEAKFIFHHGGKKHWKVTKEDLQQLDRFLSAKSAEYRRYTNWQTTIYHWNYEYGFLAPEYPDSYDTLIDAYMDGYFDTKDDLSDPAYIPSDQEQPSYADLLDRSGTESKQDPF